MKQSTTTAAELTATTAQHHHQHHLLARPDSGLSGRSISARSPIPSSETVSFHTAGGAGQSTLDRTLVDSSEVRRRNMSDDDETTLADSVVDSMHSCASTLVGSAETLHGTTMESDEEFLSDHLESASEDMQRYVRRMQRPEDERTPPVDDGRRGKGKTR